MMLDRTRQPLVRSLERMDILEPERLKMGNGVMLNVIRAGEQEVVRMDILFRGGRYQQSQPLQSLFANRMLREGSGRHTSVEIEEMLDYYGAWLELSSGMEHSQLTLYALSKHYVRLLEMVEYIIKEPAFPEKELRTTLATNRQQFLVNSRKGNFVSRKYFNMALFGPEHPSGITATAGDYEKLTTDVLRRFHDAYYCSANCSVYLSGKVTDEMLRCTERVFGSEAWGVSHTRAAFSPCQPHPSGEKSVYVRRPDAMQDSLLMGYPLIDRKHEDYLKLRVLMTLFGGYFGSRLMSNIREDKGYTYGISASILSYPYTGVFLVATEADSGYTDSIVREVCHEMDVLKEVPVCEEELSQVRNYMLGQMCRTYEGAFSLADAWVFVETNGLDNGYYGRAFDAVREVTAAELQALAEKYFRAEEFITVVAGKK